MSTLAVAGGLYAEYCTWPDWNEIWGSGGRAAAATAGHTDVTLHTYATDDVARRFRNTAEFYGFRFVPVSANVLVSFEYTHAMSIPIIGPPVGGIKRSSPIEVSADAVLRFGMLDGDARVTARRCVYDPQSGFAPERFWSNGSQARHLAIVANRQEVSALTGSADPTAAARVLLAEGAEVVVVKCGAAGALVVTNEIVKGVAAFKTENVWTIGSGDVFAATFALYWAALCNSDPVECATLASLATASYVESMSLPVPKIEILRTTSLHPVEVQKQRRVYLAGPFFSIAQRWLVDEARRCMRELSLSVFSPVHDVGRGPADLVAPADLRALDDSDVVFALVDGLDSGTLFEIGYARARNIPVFALAQSTSMEDLKMVEGSGCRVFGDFVTALHHVAWHR